MTTTTTTTTPDPTTSGRLSRRRMVAGALGAGLATATVFQIGRAQIEGGTPEASPTTENTTDASDDGDAVAADQTATALAWAAERIAAAEGDRDAVAAEIDATTVNALLDGATGLHDRAQASADRGATAEALRLAFGAGAMAEAAGHLVGAQLTYPGLPSQEARSSRVLARAHEAIQTVSDETASGTDADVTFAVSTAQALYASAYELHAGDAFTQAAATARVGTQLARVAWFLSGDGPAFGRDDRLIGGPGDFPTLDGPGHGPGHGPGRRGIRLRGERDPLGEDITDRDEPVTVPAPEF